MARTEENAVADRSVPPEVVRRSLASSIACVLQALPRAGAIRSNKVRTPSFDAGTSM